VDNAPAVSTERLRNERRFRADFIYEQKQFKAQRLRLVRSVAYAGKTSSTVLLSHPRRVDLAIAATAKERSLQALSLPTLSLVSFQLF
jgi:hypothetical protein